jgi:lipoprotein-releasing system permease protein
MIDLGRRAAPFSAWEREIAVRYLRARRKEGGVALISIISFVGIALAVAVLIIVMSVMNGFRTELLSRILGFNGHAFVTGGVLERPDLDAVIRKLKAVPGVTEAAPLVEAQAIAQGPSQITGVIVRGARLQDIKANPLVANNITGGSLAGYGQGDYGGDMVLVGERLAAALGVGPGDPISLISPSGGATAFGSTPQRKTYTVGGIFNIGMSEYDQVFIFMPLEQAQLFFGREGAVDAIEIKVKDPDRVAKVVPAIARAAGPAALVTDWTQRNAAYWSTLQIERNVMRLILMMIVAIAAMNIISGLVMLVKNKGRDIAILRTMGAGQGSVLRIFFMAGAGVGLAGTLMGLAIGVLFCTFIEEIQAAVEWVTGATVFSADVYFLSHMPAKIEWSEVAIVVGWSLAMAFLATLPPSWRASRLDPVEALRYE